MAARTKAVLALGLWFATMQACTCNSAPEPPQCEDDSACGVFEICRDGECIPCGEVGQMCCPGFFASTYCPYGDCLNGKCVPREGGWTPPDASACQAPVACETCDVSTYVPVAVGPSITMLGACTPGELQSYVTACLGDASTDASCSAWQAPDSGTCGACLEPGDAATWEYCGEGGCQLNAGGCVDFELDSTDAEIAAGGTGSCGDLINALWGCQNAACGKCSDVDLNACWLDTLTSGNTEQCGTFDQKALSATGPCAPLADAAPDARVMTCFPQSTGLAFLNVFCDTGP